MSGIVLRGERRALYWADKHRSHLLRYNLFANCHPAISLSFLEETGPGARGLPTVGIPLRPSAVQARGGQRWDERAKAFAQQLEGISSSVSLERVGQPEERCGKSAQERPNSARDAAPPL